MLRSLGICLFARAPRAPTLGGALALMLCASLFLTSGLCAEPPETSESGSGWTAWREGVKSQWGGELKLRGAWGWPDSNSIFKAVNLEPLFDGAAELRIKDERQWTSWLSSDVHYQATLLGGDTRRRAAKLGWTGPDLFDSGTPVPHSDRRRLMNLTWPIADNESLLLTNRFDRLALTVVGDGAILRLGRQGLTWGDGNQFNVYDFFNPYKPTDIEHSYKIGDDMAYLKSTLDELGTIEFVYDVRRNPDTHEIDYDQATLAAKWRFQIDGVDVDLVGASHFGDKIVGLGLGKNPRLDLPQEIRLETQGLLWHMNATWTFLDDRVRSMDGYFSLVANLGYEWLWWNRPFKGYVEFFYNGLCNNHYEAQLQDPLIVERLDRGDLFTLGQMYVSSTIESEVVPGVRALLSLLNSIEDPSGMFQPRVTWSPDPHVEVLLGSNISYGAKTTEFGGYKLRATTLYAQRPDSVYCWLRYKF